MRPPQTLRDSHGRDIGDLRISVTDRCNFRCSYCIPVENVKWTPEDEILSFREIERLIRIFINLGVRKLRITGGEPLLRKGIGPFLETVAAIEGLDDLAMTTNGRLLGHSAEALKRTGLTRLNVSLDSLQRETFFKMTKRDALAAVLEGLEAAKRVGFTRIKVNAVLIRGVNDMEILDFAIFARETGFAVRFIEFMPLDSGHRWTREQVVPGREVFETINSRFPLIRMVPVSPAETARRYRFADGQGEIGIISPVSDPFCGNCNRLRLTADGHLRTCLFSVGEYDLKGPLRTRASDGEIEGLIRVAVLGKEPGHRINAPDFSQPSRTMSCIGG